MLTILKVSGHSLIPYYQEGDFVLVAKIPFFLDRLKPGDAVAFRHPVYGTMIKIVEHIAPTDELVFVSGTHTDSLDSRQLGPIPRESLLGKVIWHIKKTPNENKSSKIS
jgi:signal peptidase I